MLNQPKSRHGLRKFAIPGQESEVALIEGGGCVCPMAEPTAIVLFVSPLVFQS
jgi:hypothetical protein